MLPCAPKFNFNRANWENFRNELSTHEELDIDEASIDTIDRETEKWFEAVTEAMENNIPKTSYRIIGLSHFPKSLKK